LIRTKLRYFLKYRRFDKDQIKIIFVIFYTTTLVVLYIQLKNSGTLSQFFHQTNYHFDNSVHDECQDGDDADDEDTHHNDTGDLTGSSSG
jgi:hypothetical protein